MDSLPAEVLVQIFNYLPAEDVLQQIPQVSDRWRDVVGSLYKPQTMNFDDTKSTEEVLHLLGCAPALTSLQMRHRPDAAEILQFVAQHNRELRSFQIVSSLPPPALRAVLTSCSEIEELTLLFVNFPFSDAEFYVDLKACLPRLRKLTVCNDNTEGVLALLRSCPPLEDLWSDHEYPDDVMELAATQHGETLKALKMRSEDWGEVGYAALTRCRRLQSLILADPVYMTDTQMMGLVALEDLRSLAIQWADSVTAEGWKAIFRARPFQNMTSLEIRDCKSFGDDELIAALIAFPGLTSLEVDLEGEVTEYSLSTLPRLTPRLRLLTLCTERAFTDEQRKSFQTLRESLQGQMPRLEFIL